MKLHSRNRFHIEEVNIDSFGVFVMKTFSMMWLILIKIPYTFSTWHVYKNQNKTTRKKWLRFPGIESPGITPRWKSITANKSSSKLLKGQILAIKLKIFLIYGAKKRAVHWETDKFSPTVNLRLKTNKEKSNALVGVKFLAVNTLLSRKFQIMTNTFWTLLVLNTAASFKLLLLSTNCFPCCHYITLHYVPEMIHHHYFSFSSAALLEILSELFTFRYKHEIWHTDSIHQYKHFQI